MNNYLCHSKALLGEAKRIYEVCFGFPVMVGHSRRKLGQIPWVGWINAREGLFERRIDLHQSQSAILLNLCSRNTIPI